jgi:CBS domain-containing protein/ribosome-associated translation inhibitor RaiA
MRLRELMRPRVVTIDSRESADAAWSQMRRHRIRHLVVTSNGQLAGVISERDLGGPHGENVRRAHTVADLMSSRVVSGEPSMTLREAANLMRGRMIGSLPVLDDGKLVGIVTATDVLDELGRGSTRPTRRPEARAERMTESRRQAVQRKRKAVHRPRVAGPTGGARPRQPDSARRAPFVRAIPKEAKTEPAGAIPQIPAYIRAAEGDLSPEDRTYIRRKLGRRLGKFASAIERVSVRTEDVNGPKGGIDHVCRIKVVLKGLPTVVLERREASLRAAIDGALAGVEMAVRRAVQRRRMKPLRRAA